MNKPVQSFDVLWTRQNIDNEKDLNAIKIAVTCPPEQTTSPLEVSCWYCLNYGCCCRLLLLMCLALVVLCSCIRFSPPMLKRISRGYLISRSTSWINDGYRRSEAPPPSTMFHASTTRNESQLVSKAKLRLPAQPDILNVPRQHARYPGSEIDEKTRAGAYIARKASWEGDASTISSCLADTLQRAKGCNAEPLDSADTDTVCELSPSVETCGPNVVKFYCEWASFLLLVSSVLNYNRLADCRPSELICPLLSKNFVMCLFIINGPPAQICSPCHAVSDGLCS